MLEMTIDSIRVSMMNYQHVVILKEKDSDRYLPIWIGPAEADAISVKLQNMDISRPLTHDLLKNTIFALESLSGTSVCRVVVNDLRADTFYAQIIFEFNNGPVPVAVVSLTEHAVPNEFEKNTPMSIIWQDKKYDLTVVNKWQEKEREFIEAESEDGLLFEVTYTGDKKRWLLTKIKLDSRPSDAIALAVRVTTPIFVEDSVLDKAGIILDRETGKPVTPARASGNPEDAGEIDEQELKKLSAFYDFINTLDLDDLGKKKS